MSAFTRRGPQGRGGADVGTRPGLHGQTLLSTGLADLDRLLGGGLPLGALLLVLEDAHSQQHAALVKHFLAEGLACGHAACWLAPRPPPGGPAAFLPPVAAPRGADAAAASASASSSAAAPSASGAAALGQPQADDDGLRIAWRYRQYIKQSQAAAAAAAGGSGPDGGPGGGGASTFKRAGAATAAAAAAGAKGGGGSGSGSSTSSAATSSSGAGAGGAARPAAAAAKAVEAGVAREWCHRFDASRGVGEAALGASRLRFRADWGPDPAAEAAAEALAFTRGLRGAVAPGADGGPAAPLPPREPGQVGRLVIQSLGADAWRYGGGGGWDGGSRDGSNSCDDGGGGGGEWGAALLQSVARLRLAVQDAHCAALITCPAGEGLGQGLRAAAIGPNRNRSRSPPASPLAQPSSRRPPFGRPLPRRLGRAAAAPVRRGGVTGNAGG
jgi:elongator complex protein 4